MLWQVCSKSIFIDIVSIGVDSDMSISHVMHGLLNLFFLHLAGILWFDFSHLEVSIPFRCLKMQEMESLTSRCRRRWSRKAKTFQTWRLENVEESEIAARQTPDTQERSPLFTSNQRLFKVGIRIRTTERLPSSRGIEMRRGLQIDSRRTSVSHQPICPRYHVLERHACSGRQPSLE